MVKLKCQYDGLAYSDGKRGFKDQMNNKEQQSKQGRQAKHMS